LRVHFPEVNVKGKRWPRDKGIRFLDEQRMLVGFLHFGVSVNTG
jgi:hypothetical protein